MSNGMRDLPLNLGGSGASTPKQYFFLRDVLPGSTLPQLTAIPVNPAANPNPAPPQPPTVPLPEQLANEVEDPMDTIVPSGFIFRDSNFPT